MIELENHMSCKCPFWFFFFLNQRKGMSSGNDFEMELFDHL